MRTVPGPGERTSLRAALIHEPIRVEGEGELQGPRAHSPGQAARQTPRMAARMDFR